MGDLVTASNGGTELAASFRQKANFMKSWKPASQPSNRDRLELYALHKQAVSGDAPTQLSTTTAADRAKYTAWKTKTGLDALEAMRLYLQEADRQLRVYGTMQSEDPSASLMGVDPTNNTYGDDSSHPGTASTTRGGTLEQPRGLAAIPLLCAAASESRQAYLRRLANTALEQAWWRRQEPLCATPGTLLALPETLLLQLASIVEYISLTAESCIPLPLAVVQSFFWPLHNCLLSLWMGLIMVYTTWTSAAELIQTLLWGSRRTGLSLQAVWKDQILFSAQSVHSLTERHQPLTPRLVGLVLLPFTLLVAITSAPPALWASLLYVVAMGTTWWYWFLLLPWLATCLLGSALLSGGCFALIELAGV